jgi:hypothetical protein
MEVLELPLVEEAVLTTVSLECAACAFFLYEKTVNDGSLSSFFATLLGFPTTTACAKGDCLVLLFLVMFDDYLNSTLQGKELVTLHLERSSEKKREEIDEKSVNGEDLSKEWFCPVYGWKL